MKIGIYCGSFNPIHKGHIKIVKEILKQKLLDKVLIVATGQYWYKTSLIPLEHRIKMLEFYKSDSILIEKEHNLTNSTYESFKIFKNIYKNDTLYLILGADNLERFDNWIEYKKLLDYPFIIIKRDNYDNKYINTRMKDFNKENYTILDIDNINISSNYIRDNFNNYSLIKDYIDLDVYNYIKNNNLL